jgi:hypothetical protein
VLNGAEVRRSPRQHNSSSAPGSKTTKDRHESPKIRKSSSAHQQFRRPDISLRTPANAGSSATGTRNPNQEGRSPQHQSPRATFQSKARRALITKENQKNIRATSDEDESDENADDHGHAERGGGEDNEVGTGGVEQLQEVDADSDEDASDGEESADDEPVPAKKGKWYDEQARPLLERAKAIEAGLKSMIHEASFVCIP